MKLTDSYRNMLAHIDEVIHLKDFSFKPNINKTIAATLFDVANEHGKAINTLFENNLDMSAFSMIRIQFETFVRACWIYTCASDSEATRFYEKDKIQADDKRPLNFGIMLKEIESKSDWGETLTSIRKNTWSVLNSYTHGGAYQASRRYDGKTIEQHHTPEERDGVIKFSALLTFLGFCQTIQICESEELDNESDKLYKTIKSWVF